jgi:ring-1,2-phenylacetyl-CoA epoxidase subunit PaaE
MEFEVVDIRQETAEVKSIYLRPLSLFPFPKAGQFITLIHTIGKKEVRRSYSLSEIPRAGEPLRITLKRTPNGIMSRRLCDSTNVGDILIADSAPTGRFSLPDHSLHEKTLWLFAAGIGISPLLSILQDWLQRSTGQVVLIYSNHTRSRTVFISELKALEQANPNQLKIVWLFSDAKNLLQARLSKESFPWLQETFLTHPREKVLAYLCGPTSYMWLCTLLLEDAGLSDTQIRREQFVIKTDPPKRLPGDKEPHQVKMLWQGNEISFENTYPQTILESARAAGFHLPYSCNAGQCGSCTMRCTEGHVWMSYNEVLTENDLKKGLVLTCTGHVVGGEGRIVES